MNLYKLDDQLTGTMSNVHSVLDYVFSVQNLKCEEGNLSDENGPQMPDCEQSDLYSLLHLTGKYFKHSSLHQQDFIFPWQSAKVHQTWSPPCPPTRSWLESLATTSPCTKFFVYETCSPRTTSLPLRTPARSTTIGLRWNLPFADSTLKIVRLFFLAYLCVFLLGNPQSRKACIKKTHREQQQHKQAYASRSNSTASVHVEFSSKTARSKPSKWERDEETGQNKPNCFGLSPWMTYQRTHYPELCRSLPVAAPGSNISSDLWVQPNQSLFLRTITSKT